MSTHEGKKISEFRGKKLKNLRLKKGLAQADLAREAGVSKQMVSQVEGGGPVGVKTAAKLAAFYKVDVKWLMEEEFTIESFKRHLMEPRAEGEAAERERVTLENRFDLFEDRVTKYIMDLEGKIEELKGRVEELEAEKGKM